MISGVGRQTLRTAGQVVDVPAYGRGSRHLRQAVGTGPTEPVLLPDRTDVELYVGPAAPATGSRTPITRGAWVDQAGATHLADVGGSGFDQAWRVTDGRLQVTTHWAPGPAAAAAALALPARRRALFGQVLLHYPVLWWAGVRGLAPLHVSVVRIEGVSLLLAGPGGVGKSTLVAHELALGAVATCDNLGVTDGTTVHGLREPLRLPADGHTGHGPRAAHDRREHPWPGRASALRPDAVVVVRRGARDTVAELDPEAARRTLVAGTFTAGELRRLWPLNATLALATGLGEALPAVEQVSRLLTDRLPCLAVDLATRGAPLRERMAGPLAELSRTEVAS